MTYRTENGSTFIQNYNTENRISSIIQLASGACASPGNYLAKWDYSYDGDGVHVATLTTPYSAGVPQTASLTSYFFGGAYEVRGDGSILKYYSFGGSMVAMKDSGGMKYLLTDHLESVEAVTNASGALLSQARYLPFGQVRADVGSISQTDLSYTGQRNLDVNVGLMDYRARFYDSYLNRWTQPDTIIPNPSNPQSLNRVSYVLNNPIRYRDPSGHVSCYGSSWEDAPYCKFKNPDAYDPRQNLDHFVRTSTQGVEFIKKWEGFVQTPTPDPAGNCSIGYGHLLHQGGCNGSDSEKVYANGVTDVEAYKLLLNDITKAEALVIDKITVPLKQNQFDALVSFAYNLPGSGQVGDPNYYPGFVNSDLLERLNRGEYAAVPYELSRWNKAFDYATNQLITLPGLTDRRNEEGLMFSEAIYSVP